MQYRAYAYVVQLTALGSRSIVDAMAMLEQVKRYSLFITSSINSVVDGSFPQVRKQLPSRRMRLHFSVGFVHCATLEDLFFIIMRTCFLSALYYSLGNLGEQC